MSPHTSKTPEKTKDFPALINSLFRKLPGDDDNFHEMADYLKTDDKIQFRPLRSIKILDCVTDRQMPFFGRAFLDANDRINLCGNATWKLFFDNKRRELQRLLLHEMVHFYDRKVENYNFYKPRDLACSEIRAYNMSSTCGGSELCVRNKALASLEMSYATRFMMPAERMAILDEMVTRCMKNTSPFKRPDDDKEK